MSLLFSQRVHTSSTAFSLKNRRKPPLGLAVLVLMALSSPALVNAVTTPSVAPGVTPSVLYYHPDATGNLIAMTDASGQMAWRAELRPFGLGTANPENHPPRFLDQPLEAEIGAEGGLYHLGARTYDPVAGRFLTTDPLPLIGIPLEEPQRFNRYAYGLNNPYRYRDPTGLAPPGAKPPKQPPKPPAIDPVTGTPAGPLPKPKVIDLDPSEGPTERIRWPGNVTEEVTEIKPGPSEEVTEISPVRPSLGEATVGEGEFDAEDKKRLAEELNRLNCAYGMDSCRPDPLVWDPIFSPLPGVGELPVSVRPLSQATQSLLVRLRTFFARPIFVRPVLVP